MQSLAALERAIRLFTSIETSSVSADRVLILSILGDIIADSDAFRIRDGLSLRPVTLQNAGFVLVSNNN
ncbi:hypothetical protein [Xanthobacter sp. 126]|uniref:hypothetical protein n=1 Tax=Xanthobacter sp. 126 TaxID=1131814 RepID=UPI0012DE34F5|nr:hypothetical protein [Xanthobacter sp. 126]